MVNRSGSTDACRPAAWSVSRRVAGGWTRVVAGAADEPRVELAPAGSYTWLVSAAGVAPEGVDRRVFVDLPAGRYAFCAPFGGPARVAAVAPFGVGR